MPLNSLGGGDTIRIGREMLCLPYAEFFFKYKLTFLKVLDSGSKGEPIQINIEPSEEWVKTRWCRPR